LGQHGDDAVLYAGGTELLLAMKEGLLRYDHLVNLKTVPGSDRLEYNGPARELHIGPAVTHRALEHSLEVAAQFPLIAAAEANALAEVRTAAAKAATEAAATLIAAKHDAAADKALVDQAIASVTKG